MKGFILDYKSLGKTAEEHLEGENYLHDICSGFDKLGYKYVRWGYVDNEYSIDRVIIKVMDGIVLTNKSLMIPGDLPKKPASVQIVIHPIPEDKIDSNRIVWQFYRPHGAGATDWVKPYTKATDEITGISVVIEKTDSVSKSRAVTALSTLVDAHNNPEKSIFLP